MSLLPLQTFTNAPKDWSCPICLEEDNATNLQGHLFQTTKGHYQAHVYHKVCLEQWIKSHHNCPTCKRVFSKNRNIIEISSKSGLITFFEMISEQADISLVNTIYLLGYSTLIKQQLPSWGPISLPVLGISFIPAVRIVPRALTFSGEKVSADGHRSFTERALNNSFVSFGLASLALVSFALQENSTGIKAVRYQIFSFLMHLIIHAFSDRDVLTSPRREFFQNVFIRIYLTASFLCSFSTLLNAL